MQFTLLETAVYHRWLWAELAETGELKESAKFWGHIKKISFRFKEIGDWGIG